MKVFGAIRFYFLILLILVIIFLIVFALILNEINLDNNTLTISALVDIVNFFYLFISIVSSVMIIRFALLLFEYLLRLGRKPILGSTSSIRWMSLGISAVVYSNAIILVLRGILTFILSSLDIFPSTLYDGWNRAQAICLGAPQPVGSDCIVDVVFVFFDTLFDAIELTIVQSEILRWDYAQLIYFAVFAIFLGQMFSTMFVSEQLAELSIPSNDQQPSPPESTDSSPKYRLRNRLSFLFFNRQTHTAQNKDATLESHQSTESSAELSRTDNENPIDERNLVEMSTANLANYQLPVNTLTILLAGFYNRKAVHKNILFAILLLFGTYLTVASVISLPILLTNDTGNLPEISVGSLEQRVESENLQIDEINKENNPFESLQNYLDTTDSESVSGTQVIVNIDLGNFELNQQKNARLQLLQLYDELVIEATRLVDDSRLSSVEAYRLNSIERIGTRENATYFLELVNWYQLNVSFASNSISKCASSFEAMDDEWVNWSSFVIQELEQSEILLSPPSRFAYGRVMDDCSNILQESPLPERLPLGSFTGPFGQAAGWILETESLDLAIIVGLFGFGLIGALSSTAIREQALRNISDDTTNNNAHEDGAIVDDIVGVLLRGITAAVIVYLAGQGGLVIFAESGSRPNPYALLLICFIGAVFSETIWEWARRRLDSYINYDNNPTDTLNDDADDLATTPETPEEPSGYSDEQVISLDTSNDEVNKSEVDIAAIDDSLESDNRDLDNPEENSEDDQTSAPDNQYDLDDSSEDSEDEIPPPDDQDILDDNP